MGDQTFCGLSICDRRSAILISYIHHTSELKQYCHVGTQHNNADLACFKTQTLRATLRTLNQPLGESYENSHVEHSFREFEQPSNVEYVPRIQQNYSYEFWMSSKRNASMFIGISMDQEICTILGQVSLMENARKLRGIYFIDLEDKEFKETTRNAQKKLETSVALAMLRKIMKKNCGSGTSNKIKNKTCVYSGSR